MMRSMVMGTMALVLAGTVAVGAVVSSGQRDRIRESAAVLNEITADPTWQPTFVFYMGYPKLSAHASPRRPVQAVLV